MTEERADNGYIKLSFLDKHENNNNFLKPSLGKKAN
jgi:hypothetical protein